MQKGVPWDAPVFSYGLYLGVAFLAFCPCLIVGRCYSCNDLLQYYSEANTFLKDQLLRGHFPLWDPYLFCGQPFFADPNTAACYPLHYLALLFPIPYGFSAFFFIHMVVAAFGMHFWLRGHALSQWACRVGALIFALSGFFWWQLLDPPLLASFSWSPWLLGCLERALKGRNSKWAFLAGLCFAIIFCCGHIQSATYIFYGGIAYLLLLMSEERGSPAKLGIKWKKGAILLLWAAWGSLPLLVQLVPAYEFFSHSYRSNPVLTYDNFNATFSMVPSSISEFLFPHLGLPSTTTLEEGIVKFDDKDPYKDNPYFGVMGYLGIWTPFLMLLSFLQKDKKRAAFMWFLCLTAVLTAWGHYSPLHRWECLLLPWINLSRAPSRILGIYVLFASALAAHGYESLRDCLSSPRNGRPILLISGIYFLVLLLASLADPSRTWVETAALVLGMGGLGLCFKGGSWRKYGRGTFLASLIAPLLLSGWNGFSTGPASNYDFEEGFPAFRYLEQKAPLGRYLFDPDLTYQTRDGKALSLQPLSRNAPEDFGIRSTGGNESFFLQKSFDLTRLPGGLFARLTAVKGLVWKYPMQESPGISHHSFPGAEVYEPLDPPPFLNAPYLPRVVSDDQEALQWMKSPGFDPSRHIVLSDHLPSPIISRLTRRPAALTYSLENENPDDQVFKVRLDEGSLVVFSEIMYPGWKAWIDGERTPVFTGDYTFRTLFVPTGEHDIEFRFEPAWARPLLAGLLLWLASVLGYGLFKGWTGAARPSKMGHA